MSKKESCCECGREITVGVWVDLAKTKDGVVFPILKPVKLREEDGTFDCDELVETYDKLLSFDTEAFTKDEIESNGFEIGENGSILNAGALCPYCNKWL